MYNKLIVIGNLTKDIELKHLPSGSTIAKGSIATSYKYKLSSGEQKEEVCFIDFNIFGNLAVAIYPYLNKGSKVMIEGRLILEQWRANDGTNRNKHTLKVDTMKILDSKPTDSQPQSQYKQISKIQGEQPLDNNLQKLSEQTLQKNYPDISIEEIMKGCPF